MLQLNRIYINSDGDEIRVDNIIMEKAFDPINLNSDQQEIPYKRILSKTVLNISSNRTVSEIQILGNYDICDTVSGDFTYANWYYPKTTTIMARCNMSNLPKVGEDV